MRPLFVHFTRWQIERRNRIRIALWAYAYEIKDDSLVSDGEFDKLAREIDLSIKTNRPDLDEWFIKEFNPSTGQWVRRHPELEKLERIYKCLKM